MAGAIRGGVGMIYLHHARLRQFNVVLILVALCLTGAHAQQSALNRSALTVSDSVRFGAPTAHVMWMRPLSRPGDQVRSVHPGQRTIESASQQGRHAIYGAIAGGAVGTIVGLVASNACKGGLCQDQRASVTLTAVGIGAFVGGITGWFLPVSDP